MHGADGGIAGAVFRVMPLSPKRGLIGRADWSLSLPPRSGWQQGQADHPSLRGGESWSGRAARSLCFPPLNLATSAKFCPLPARRGVR